MARIVGLAPATLALVTFPFAWWLGFILGGNFGGASIASVTQKFGGMDAIFIPIGIGIGIFTVTTILCLLTAGAAFLILRVASLRK